MDNKLRITKNLIYSTLSVAVATLVLQLLIYPMLAKHFESNLYGQILTAMGIINALAISIGNTLNNVRLIQLEEYDENDVKGDFNVILGSFNIICFVIIFLISLIWFDFSNIEYVLMSILGVFITFKSYYLVVYRIKLDYKSYFFNSVITSLGYIIGIYIAYITRIWVFSFILGEVFSILYIYLTTNVITKDLNRSAVFGKTLNKFIVVLLSSLLVNGLLYLDRLLLYPLLGPETVSVYSVAAFFGKTLGVIATPIAGVMLSYYSRKEFKMSNNRFNILNICFIFGGAIFIIFMYFLGPFFTKMIYPTLYEAALPYLTIASVAMISIAVNRLIQPAILKFCPTKINLLKEILYAIVYIVLAILFINEGGLLWFCYSVIIANIIKFIVMVVLGNIYLSKSEMNKEG